MNCECKECREVDDPATHNKTLQLIGADESDSDSDTDEEVPGLMDVDEESDSDSDFEQNDLLSGTSSNGKYSNPCKNNLIHLTLFSIHS